MFWDEVLLKLNGFVWLLLLLGPLFLLQRQLHREIQSVFLLITRRVDVSLGIFSIIFFPGVLLHEVSHFVMARILGVRTGNFSLFPKTLENGRLQLGYVETAPTDIFRDSLIGAAPLLSGGLFVLYAGIYQLNLETIWASLKMFDLAGVWIGLSQGAQGEDFWLWFYLVFTVSSTMLPSASDRRAWRPLALVGIFLLVLGVIAGLGSWFFEPFLILLNNAMAILAAIFGISVAIHAVLLVPTWGLRVGLSHLFHMEVR